MQKIHTFVVKVLHEPGNAGVLHGLLTSVATGDQFPFTDGENLLELLMRISFASHLSQNLPVSDGQPLKAGSSRTSFEKESWS